jgi:hypothetical protein
MKAGSIMGEGRNISHAALVVEDDAAQRAYGHAIAAKWL